MDDADAKPTNTLCIRLRASVPPWFLGSVPVGGRLAARGRGLATRGAKCDQSSGILPADRRRPAGTTNETRLWALARMRSDGAPASCRRIAGVPPAPPTRRVPGAQVHAASV